MEYLTFMFLIRTISTDVFLIKPLMEIDLSQRHSSAVEAEAYRLLEVLFCQRFSCRRPHNDSTHSNSSQCRLGFRHHSMRWEKDLLLFFVLWLRIPSASYYSLVILTQIYLSRGNRCCSFLPLNLCVSRRDSCQCISKKNIFRVYWEGKKRTSWVIFDQKREGEYDNIWGLAFNHHLSPPGLTLASV